MIVSDLVDLRANVIFVLSGFGQLDPMAVRISILITLLQALIWHIYLRLIGNLFGYSWINPRFRPAWVRISMLTLFHFSRWSSFTQRGSISNLWAMINSVQFMWIAIPIPDWFAYPSKIGRCDLFVSAKSLLRLRSKPPINSLLAILSWFTKVKIATSDLMSLGGWSRDTYLRKSCDDTVTIFDMS
jgi:hypothetical protein